MFNLFNFFKSKEDKVQLYEELRTNIDAARTLIQEIKKFDRATIEASIQRHKTLDTNNHSDELYQRFESIVADFGELFKLSDLIEHELNQETDEERETTLKSINVSLTDGVQKTSRILSTLEKAYLVFNHYATCTGEHRQPPK